MSWMGDVARESMAENVISDLETEIERVQTYHHYTEEEKKVYVEALKVAIKIVKNNT